MEKLTPGYFDERTGNYYFASSGKGGKVFMTLWFNRLKPGDRHRLKTEELPIRFMLEDARADLALYGQRHGYEFVSDIFEHKKARGAA